MVYSDDVHSRGIPWNSLLHLMFDQHIDVLSPYIVKGSPINCMHPSLDTSKVISPRCYHGHDIQNINNSAAAMSHYTHSSREQVVLYRISTSSQFALTDTDYLPNAFDKNFDTPWSSKGISMF